MLAFLTQVRVNRLDQLRLRRTSHRGAEGLARERELADRVTRLIEDQRPRGFWARVFRRP